jgi:GT2 family glycosyltransferase
LKTDEVFSPCAAAALYSLQAFLLVGGFDEDFFSYHEDVDLGFRLRLRGFRCLYVPEAVVQHIGSAALGPQSDFALYHWQRNFIWSFVQNMPPVLFWIALPAHLMANLIFILKYTLQGRGKIIWKAKMDAVNGLRRAFHKRRDIQKYRKVSRGDLLQKMERGFFQPYVLGYQLRRIQKKSPSKK